MTIDHAKRVELYTAVGAALLDLSGSFDMDDWKERDEWDALIVYADPFVDEIIKFREIHAEAEKGD